MSDTTLVIGDAHVDPSQVKSKHGLRRFEWAAKYIRDVKPDRVVIIGDWFTLDSISSHNDGRFLTKEGLRYQKDIDCGMEALQLIADANGKSPIIFCEGNHEERAARFIEGVPELQGAIVTPYQAVQDDIDVWVPYKNYWTHKGVSFTHVPINEGGKPVSGKYAVLKALDICDNSVVFGHTHKLGNACVHRHGSSHLQQSLNVGCFFEHIDDYAKGSVTSYWRGLVLLNHYDYGRVDYETISLGRLRREYGA